MATRFVSAKLSMIAFAGLFGLNAFAAQTMGQTTTDQSQHDDAPDQALNDEIKELRRLVQDALVRMSELARKLDTRNSDANFQQQLDDERAHLEAIESRIDALAAEVARHDRPGTMHRVAETTPGLASGLAPADIYRDGFFVSTGDQSFSMYVNGLFQIRYTGFTPQQNVDRFGVSTASSSNFDVFLGRLAVSGSAFGPTLKYFLQFQGSSVGDGNAITLLDWFTAKTISKFLTIQAGRSWTPYTYEFYVNPGDLLLPDLPSTEYAFGLSRTIGVQAYGQAGRFSYAAMIGNSIPALDAAGQENFNGRLSYIGHFQYDILAPYGYIESDPSRAQTKPALTFWASAGYNPVSEASNFQNVRTGDKTANATSTLMFRYRRFTYQSTGYYRRTEPANSRSAFNSWGFAQQAGIYIAPGRLELAGRASGVNWGAANFPVQASTVNTWFAGPNFPYHRIDEGTLGVNYYFRGHNVKLQAAYSHLFGASFDGLRFGANRLWVQSQVMF